MDWKKQAKSRSTWWFASTAFPLMAATIGPLCNILSIAALVTPWRMTLANQGRLPDGKDDSGIGITDPKWEIALNAISLACGFTGNLFLLTVFTGSVRYVVALPLSVALWLLSSALTQLIGITTAMHIHLPPIAPAQVYSQGFWHAILAASLYLLGAAILMVNLAGYLSGHCPPQFDLDNDQRTLILQTMGFFFWMAAGAGVFCGIEGFTFTNALYFADVSVLTIGFGDIYPVTNAGRGFLFVFELLGVIQLGLVISSITRFVTHISADKITRTHQHHARQSTIGRAVTNEADLRERLGLPRRRSQSLSISQYGILQIVDRNVVVFHPHDDKTQPPSLPKDQDEGSSVLPQHCRHRRRQKEKKTKKMKLLYLQAERDRFHAMRAIQSDSRRFQQYSALALSLVAFSALWFLGAVVFKHTEARELRLTYFEALYFCFVSLTSIGYGDFHPQSNIGKPFFIVWSVFAVPTMTVLIQKLSATVIAAVVNHRGTTSSALAGPTTTVVLPRKRGKEVASLASTNDDNDNDLALQLSKAIQSVAQDLRASPPRRYTFDEWMYFRNLMIRSSSSPPLAESKRLGRIGEEGPAEEHEEAAAAAAVHGEESFVDWDWLGEDSPLLAGCIEAEWVLNRLCASLNCYAKQLGSC